MNEFLVIARNAIIIMIAIGLFSSFFVVTSVWVARNTVEPEKH